MLGFEPTRLTAAFAFRLSVLCCQGASSFAVVHAAGCCSSPFTRATVCRAHQLFLSLLEEEGPLSSRLYSTRFICQPLLPLLQMKPESRGLREMQDTAFFSKAFLQ